VVYDTNIPTWYPTAPVVQVTDFPSWRSVVEWALPLYTDADAPLATIHDVAASLGPNASAIERAALALEFVQREIRYLGIEEGVSSHRPSPPGDVLARRFGDCKDKARLLVSLLHEMDIQAMPVLVHSTRRQALADWLPSPLDFNHVIVLVRIGGADFLVDPTLSYQAGGLRQRHTARYRTGLVIDPATTGLSPWPEAENDMKRTLVDETFSISAIHGETNLEIRSTYHGRAAEDMRSYLGGTTRDDLGKSYTDFYARYYPDISLKTPVTWTDDSATNTITVSEQYAIQRIFVPQADTAMLKAEFFPTALNGYTNSPGAGGRTAPLAIPHPVEISTRTRVHLPELWSVKPESVQVKDPAFTFNFAVSGKGREIEWTYFWHSRADHLLPADVLTYSRNLARVNDSLGYKLTYNTAVAGDAVFHVNWAMVALAGLTAAGSAFGAHRVWRTRKPPEPPPLPSHARDNLTGLGGWLILVAIGIVLRPVLILTTIVSTFHTYVNLDTWHVLTAADSASYQPSYAVIAPAEMVVNIVLLVGTLLLAALFFGRRRAFPRVMIGFLVLQLATTIFEIWATHALTTTSVADHVSRYRDTFQAALAAAIWIPYFLVSRRVKLTFTR
jgi:transglutaminase-like putative cysteine protease